jgi:N-acetylglucosaminyl-diphospho-decaprenol L-rhamnosyltransferase
MSRLDAVSVPDGVEPGVRPIDLSVVIVSYNTVELLRGCLASIFEQTSGLSFEVVVVDNASTDGSAAMVAEQFPSVDLVALDTNVGFARACNLGAARSGGDDLVLLNPDTVVLDGALNRLSSFARAHPGAGICGGRTLTAEGSVDPSSCLGAPSPWSLACYALGLSTLFRRSSLFNPEWLGRWDRGSVRHVDVVTGCLLLLPRRLWDELGGFDDRFFMYGEDVDLCLRASALGYRPAITPDATVVHRVGSSSPSRSAKKLMVLKGKVTLITKHWGPTPARFGRWMLQAGVGLRAAGARLQGLAGGAASSPWPELWRTRRDWSSGWTDAP